jgi:SAM-dependent methyltransferase
MNAVTASFTGSIPEYYDRYLGPVYFEPFAIELAQRVAASSACDVLEIACGTGLVTRHVRARISPEARLVATDVSPAMVAYARKNLAGLPNIDWREANAMTLPFRDGAFGAVVCGFGLMFVPDRVAALSEARRVLADDGAIHLSVWDAIEHNPHGAASAEVIEGLRPGDAELRFRVPYELHDSKQLQELLAQAGFMDARVEVKRLPIEAPGARSLATGAIRGTPRSSLLEQRGFSLDSVIDKLTARLTEIGGAQPYRSYAQALIVHARKNR